MVQILLIGIGILILIKGNLKVSYTKEIVRPQSIYWGLIVIAYGIAVSFLPNQLIYSLIFYVSLILISAIFLVKGKTIASSEAIIKSTNAKRNLIILLVFGVIVVAVFYFV
ncbi:MAG: hypothetical protein A3B96_02870 [Candidatus Spechtbacteria bacterium RIFCSPHIGHO2_02_FULL_43_15b]|uniref:Uncharacterized protein n=1 Tax=Candidatus Spechtbacteria bacterium RIFCSPHIGHO2_01_FULL_43_30 TaxID=1802158 RepID=A0A1G2H4L6_9BACT|nr:MAG: hypothetical protein A2827_01500 [Candidatus Spechtbacteria bacterium RIFCSPHIGHO2_01_FULL_43_30]OGZ59929.1 MAG: hypothetical protein A3B96_02870 [Candidatus Spechtbacteria bacterium RIFCSPHIGHO2_02_FULL_43_15b]